MGGIVIGVITLGMTLFLADMSSTIVMLCFCYVLFAGIGLFDDIAKIYLFSGIWARTKLYFQIICAAIVVCFWVFLEDPSTVCIIPFFNYSIFDWGYLFIPWSMFVLIGSSNAINLTDGLDGLATIVLLPIVLLLSLIAFFSGNQPVFIFGIALATALLAFLCVNWYPAKLFMGDVGSLSLGATVAFMALLLRQELLFACIAIIPIVETLSVILQVAWYTFFKKRLFLMAPLHHHFELLGFHENLITILFGTITFISCVIAFCFYQYTYT